MHIFELHEKASGKHSPFKNSTVSTDPPRVYGLADDATVLILARIRIQPHTVRYRIHFKCNLMPL
jgi:hypothetical protein